MTWKIPLADINIDEDEKLAVQRVLDSGWLTMGEETQNFEAEFAAKMGVQYAYAVTNGTAALHMACLAAGLQPGDEAIVPALTFVATANAILYTGAMPIFADICSEDDLTISPVSIEKLITEKTRAIVVMHYGGYACDMKAILDIAYRNHLMVIEDAAHAPGAEFLEKKLGTLGDVGCYSFFSNKNLTTGEGGMVVTNDAKIADKLRVIRSHGMTTLTWDRHRGHAWSYDVVDLGYNYRIDEIRSAIGRSQLQKLDLNNRQRAELAEAYRRQLCEMAPSITIPFSRPRGISSHHLQVILLPGASHRRDFMEAMRAQGVQTSIHYPPIHQFQYYRENISRTTDLSITETVASREVTLPLYPTMKPEAVTQIVEAVRLSLASIPTGS